MQESIRAKSAWASLLKPDFTRELSSTLSETDTNVGKGRKVFHINPSEIVNDKQKWNTSIIWQVVGNTTSFL